MILADPAARALWSRLQDYAFDPPGRLRTLRQRLCNEQGWSAAHAERVLDEYRRFLLLTQVAGQPVSPSPAVDAAWHAHLLQSRDYWEQLCRDTLGRPLHHDPNPGGAGETARHRAQYRETLAHYARVFGAPPPGDLWPDVDTAFAHRPGAHPGAADGRFGDEPFTLTADLLAGRYSDALLAWLAGGDDRVTALALARLHQRGWIGFEGRRPVPAVGAALHDPRALSPEEATVWQEITRLNAPGAPADKRMTLHYPHLQQEAEQLGLTQPMTTSSLADRPPSAVLPWLGTFVLFLGGVALTSGPMPPLGLVVLGWALVRLFRQLKPFSAPVPTRGQFVIDTLRRLLPDAPPRALNDPMLGAVVALGAFALLQGSELQAMKTALTPPSSDSGGGGCSGTGCGNDGGGDGGGDGGSCGGGGD